MTKDTVSVGGSGLPSLIVAPTHLISLLRPLGRGKNPLMATEPDWKSWPLSHQPVRLRAGQRRTMCQ